MGFFHLNKEPNSATWDSTIHSLWTSTRRLIGAPTLHRAVVSRRVAPDNSESLPSGDSRELNDGDGSCRSNGIGSSSRSLGNGNDSSSRSWGNGIDSSQSPGVSESTAGISRHGFTSSFFTPAPLNSFAMLRPIAEIEIVDDCSRASGVAASDHAVLSDKDSRHSSTHGPQSILHNCRRDSWASPSSSDHAVLSDKESRHSFTHGPRPYLLACTRNFNMTQSATRADSGGSSNCSVLSTINKELHSVRSSGSSAKSLFSDHSSREGVGSFLLHPEIRTTMSSNARCGISKVLPYPPGISIKSTQAQILCLDSAALHRMIDEERAEALSNSVACVKEVRVFAGLVGGSQELTCIYSLTDSAPPLEDVQAALLCVASNRHEWVTKCEVASLPCAGIDLAVGSSLNTVRTCECADDNQQRDVSHQDVSRSIEFAPNAAKIDLYVPICIELGAAVAISVTSYCTQANAPVSTHEQDSLFAFAMRLQVLIESFLDISHCGNDHPVSPNSSLHGDNGYHDNRFAVMIVDDLMTNRKVLRNLLEVR